MRAFAIFAFLLLIPSSGFSATVYVPDDHPTIQDAIDAAVDGDTVIVRLGTYVEDIDFIGKAITVKSEMGPDVTVIDGNQALAAVTCNSGEGSGSILKGFTITNASYSGFLCDYSSSPLIVGNIISRNMNGIYCELSSCPTIENNTITDNIGPYEDHGGIWMLRSSPIIINNVIADNSGSWGGGIGMLESSPIISNNTITRNSSPTFCGGGIYCSQYSAPLISGNEISQNTCHASGGGFYSVSCSPIITGNLFHENISGSGGGLYCRAESPFISGNRFKSNTANTRGGGAYLKCNGSFQDNIVCNNDALYGGGVASYPHSEAVFANNRIYENTASYGGGIYADFSWNEFVNNTICSNSADHGGGLFCSNKSPTVINTILWNNKALLGKEIYIDDLNTTLTISFSCIENGVSSVYVNPGNTLIWGPGMIDADPLFLDPAKGDFHIPFDSPCRSAGDRNAPNLPETDFEGDPRTGLFAFPDIGADEFHTHFYVNGTVSNGSNATGVIIGWPKTNPVMLISGSGVLPNPDSTPYGDFWLMPPWEHRVHFNAMPDNGVRLIDRVVSTGLPPGSQIPFQALVGTELSNLWVVEIE